MARESLMDEVKWLQFRNQSHMHVLLCLLAKTKMDTADQAFAPIYALAAAGAHVEQYVAQDGVDYDGLILSSAKMGPEVNAMIALAAALSDPPRPADVRKTFEALANTPSFEVAVQAVRLRWEL